MVSSKSNPKTQRINEVTHFDCAAIFSHKSYFCCRDMSTWKWWWMKFYVSEVRMPACSVPFLMCTTQMDTNQRTYTDCTIWSTLQTLRDQYERLYVINQTNNHVFLLTPSLVKSVTKIICVAQLQGSVIRAIMSLQNSKKRGEESIHIFTFGHCKSVPVDKDSASSMENKE